MAKTGHIPCHIAIIMDGNGRWAEMRGGNRILGHREGAHRVDEVVTQCRELGVRYLTLYTFSTENWHRPSNEVRMLMRLFAHYLRKNDNKLLNNQISLTAQGSLERLPKFVQDELRRVMDHTALVDPAMTLNLCVSYGGRQEIVDAARKIGEKILRGDLLPSDVDEQLFAQHLYRPEIPNPDLLIRTGGEWRVSNFLLWEIAYSEMYVTEVLWPDFHAPELLLAIDAFRLRQRRFGRTPRRPSPSEELTSNPIQLP